MAFRNVENKLYNLTLDQIYVVSTQKRIKAKIISNTSRDMYL